MTTISQSALSQRARKGRSSTFDANLGQRIRELRVGSGRTQEWLAAQLDLTFQQVQKYEKGTNRVSSHTLSRIAGIFHVSIASLMEESADIRPRDEPWAKLARSRAGYDVMLSLVGLSDHQLSLIAAVSRGMQSGNSHEN